MSTTSTIVVLIITWAKLVAPSTTFSDDNPIRQVVFDGLRELETSVLQVIGRTHHALAFARFVHSYGKKYQTSDEMKRRYSIFVQSLETITSHNNKGLSYTLGINEFADMTWEEFSKSKLGASQNCSATKKGNHKLTDDILPLTQDWREAGIVSPVKTQGSCGACWTFSTTGALEAAYAQAYGKPVNLSEQQLLDCAGDYNNFGCKGGLPSQAYEYIMYNGGLDTEEAYPYIGEDDRDCEYSQEKAAVQVVNVVNITEGSEDELKHAVGVVRPVSVAFQVVPPFGLYSGGVFTSDVCHNGSMDVNHAVVAVGYGVENGVPYWLMKNSWGTKWGLNGYFKMEMGKNMCGMSQIFIPR
ncbi:vanillin synthase-like [Bidens hawaiensis]|uniref:vanillin synthase-like n=1 Tax=Bidens hawaiensis TaxID=980011 RepID=UPI00404B6B6D